MSHTARRAELRAAAAAALVALLAALLLGGCGSGESPAEAQPPAGSVIDISGTDPVGEVTAGSVASLVECADWNGATEKERLATIADVRGQLNPVDGGIDAPALTDEEAEETFDNSCAPKWAEGLRLYKLYAHAQGFVTLKRALEAGE